MLAQPCMHRVLLISARAAVHCATEPYKPVLGMAHMHGKLRRASLLCRVVSHSDLCCHFPPGGLPALEDLRLYGTKLTSNLDYRGEATHSLASTLITMCIATQQSNTAIVLAQQLRSAGKRLQVLSLGMTGCAA